MISTSSAEPPPLPPAATRGLVQDLFASLLSLKGRTSEAVAQRRAALEKLEAILGPDHPELQPSIDQLAMDLLRLEDFVGATSIVKRTYEHRVAQLGLEHPDTLERLALLTECLLSARQPSEALPLLHHQLSLSQRVKGPEHEDTLTVMQSLAKAFNQQGDQASAERMLRQSHSGFERTLGTANPKYLASLYTLFENLSEGPNPADAEPWGEKLLTAAQELRGYSHPMTISAAQMVAGLYGRRHDFAAGAAVLRRALAAFPSKKPLSIPQAQLQCLLAASLDLAGQIDEADAVARSAAYALRTHLGPSNAEADQAYRLMIDISSRRMIRTPWGRFQICCWRFVLVIWRFFTSLRRFFLRQG